MEFIGTIGVALYGQRTWRNLSALALAVLGVTVLIDVKWSGDPLGLAWATANGALFVAYILLGHAAAASGAGAGVERLGAAMAVAFLAVMPVGVAQAAKAFGAPGLVRAGRGVGLWFWVVSDDCRRV